MTAATEPIEQQEELGPAVLPGFGEVAGLETLVAESQAQKRTRTEQPQKPLTPLQGDVVSEKVLTSTLAQVDGVVSALIEVQAEAPEELAEYAKGLLPLANYYASQQPSVTTLWIVAGLSLLSYAGLKFARFRAKGTSHDQAVTE